MPRIEIKPQWLATLKWHSGSSSWRDAERSYPDGTEWYDDTQPGLILRGRGGRLAWSVRYLVDGTDYRRVTVGAFPGTGLKQARALAARHRGAAAAGDDPAAARRAARDEARKRKLGQTVKGALGSWLKDAKQGPKAKWKGGLEGGTARSLMPHVRRLEREHGERKLADLTPKHVADFVSAPEAASTRNHALTVVRLFLAWARRLKLVARVDAEAMVEDVKREAGAERKRVLTDDELRTLVQGFEGTRLSRAVRLLALTALRRDEVLGMRWDWLDLDSGVVTVPAEADKSAKTRHEAARTALSPAAVQLLSEQRAALFAEGVRSEFVFATSTGARPHPDALKPILYRLRGRRSNGLPPSTDKRAKERTAVLPDDVTVHDVRRTVANALLNRLGVNAWVVEHAVLGHVRPKLARTYMPELPLGDAREALTRWSAELERILAGRSAMGTQEKA